MRRLIRPGRAIADGVGEEQRLLDVVGDEAHRLVVALPHAEQEPATRLSLQPLDRNFKACRMPSATASPSGTSFTAPTASFSL